ncbi:MAG: hypothetical protein NVS3B16_01280 [Vulcanimicrobiaceae bacterium]
MGGKIDRRTANSDRNGGRIAPNRAAREALRGGPRTKPRYRRERSSLRRAAGATGALAGSRIVRRKDALQTLETAIDVPDERIEDEPVERRRDP